MQAKWLRVDLLVIYFVCLFTATVQAQSKTHVSGFGSIVGYHADSSELAFRTNIASSESGSRGEFELLDLSLVGFQVNHQFNPQWDFVSQVVFRRERTDDFSDRVKIATLNYSPNPEWLVRVGRFSPKLYLLSDTRFIGYSQDTVYPVHDFYAQIPVSSIDGIDVGFQKRFGRMFLAANAYTGNSDVWVNIEGFDVITPLKDLFGANVAIEYGSWLFRAGYTKATHDGYNVDQSVEQFANTLAAPPPALGLPGWNGAVDLLNAYRIKNTDFSYSSLAVEYNKLDGYWRGELGKLATDSYLAPDSIAGYVQYTHRLGKLSPFIVVSSISTEDGYQPSTQPSPLLLAALSAATQTDVAQSLDAIVQSLNVKYEQHSLTLGFRLDLQADIAFKAQIQRAWVHKDGAGLWFRDTVARNPAEVVNILAVGLDWVF
ncbi:hypothetical protein DS2_17085 [Catenovulum agarivorans DS-2]|uniref:Porin n=1 Tax=Catenovulum agarivorans DS-2 TaxID=1328313 RepID=W7Q8Y3_9ALTE|nr:hypothetical protein [Catenovulum agarivorans]EWH08476.1 hypothetical protein DS2_17085 [Catenovulum agarivorans DS-2]